MLKEIVYKEYYGTKYYIWDNIPADKIPNIETDKGKAVLVAGTKKKEKYTLHGEYNNTFTLLNQNNAYMSFKKEAVVLA